jgi:hypothetical protein
MLTRKTQQGGSMPTRRSFLAYALGAPAVLHGRRYTAAEIQRLIERGHVRGKISKDDLPTPALLLDLDAFEANVRRMAEHLRRHGLAFRPHGKTHKCGEIAGRLIRAGAVGCCAAKISEAEAFARDGIRGLLITTPVVGRHKIERAVALARRCPDTIFAWTTRRTPGIWMPLREPHGCGSTWRWTFMSAAVPASCRASPR